MLTGFLILVARGLTGATRVVESLAVGTLSRDGLRSAIARSWDDFRQDREEILRGLFDWEHRVLDETLRPGDRVLIVGCGTGRELIALAARSHAVVGVDPSGRAVRLARTVIDEMRLNAEVLEGFFEDVAFPGAFDAIIFSHRAYGLIPGSRFRVAALRKAAGLLTDRGRIILSYLNGRGMNPLLVRAARIGAVLGRSNLQIERGDEVHRGPRGFLFEHHFGPGECADEAVKAGLSVENAWDGVCSSLVLTRRQSIGRVDMAEVGRHLGVSPQSKAVAG